MKSRFKISPNQKTSVSIRTMVVYTVGSIALFGLLTWAAVFYLNVGAPENALAAGSSYTSNRSGNWSTGSTWNGGTAPTNNLNGDDITIATGHSVTLNTTLTAQNNSTFIISGTLTINGDLDVENNLILTITGRLIVNGKINVKNGSAITINGGGNLTSSGDMVLGQNANVTVNGTMNIGGSLSFGVNAVFNGTGTVAVTGPGCNGWTGSGNCNDNTVLPIELISFVAANSNDGVTVTWKTASELNNDHFTIERSKDGITYEEIKQLNGSGTTNKITTYEYLDLSPLPGISYYRLSQTDYDGKSETFKPASVQRSASEKNVMQVYPNPIVGSTLHVSFSAPEKGNLQLLDSRGKAILSGSVDGSSSTMDLDIDANLQPGVYYLNFISGSTKQVVKLVK
jgi:hypothetical protein